MKLYIYQQLKQVLACMLAVFFAIAQPVYGLAAAGAEQVGLLNDRAADITGSAPLQVPGLVIPEGLTGKGVIVGMTDSGLDKGSLVDIHPDLQSETGRIPRVVMLKSYTDRLVPDDPVGHGTHMAATVVGSGEASNGQFKGIASGASLYFQAILDKNGAVKLPENIQDLYSSAYAAGVRIHINGWGEGANSYINHTRQIDEFVDKYPNFLPIFGSGNNGPAKSTLTSEANSKNALVVGSSEVPRPVFSPEAHKADEIAPSSSRGPAQGGRIKPDLIAPGSAVISACSRLTDSNYSANTSYSLMGGTSMAASVTGGSCALLYEYLQRQLSIKQPSSSLIKALLINGARTIGDYPSTDSGFGLIDLAGTILPLKEGSFQIAEGEDLVDGAVFECSYQVTDSSRPFKASLAWVDSPTPNGATSKLVDNLNLEVVDPDGRICLGNDFLGKGVIDEVNNVEQVIINQPRTGNYTVRIKAGDLHDAVSANHYALVFGQLLRHEVVRRVESGNKLLLASGGMLDLTSFSMKGSLNARQYFSKKDEIITGSDVYIGSQTAYIFCRNWENGGVQILEEDKGSLLVEMDPDVRQGGYYLDKTVVNDPGLVILNNVPVAKISDIPVGAKVLASINPQLQTVWGLKASYRLYEGFIEQIDLGNKTLKILQDPTVYHLADWTAISCQDKLVASTDMDAPYGSINRPGMEVLTPSGKISMVVYPANNEVEYIKIERDTVLGIVDEVDTGNQKIKMQDGKSYHIYPGAQIMKDGQPCYLKDIIPEDKISGLFLGTAPGGLTEIQAYSSSSMVYGRVVYFNPLQGVLYLFDSSNQFKIYQYSSKTTIYQGGMPFETAAVNPGDWVRLVLAPKSQQIWRIDLARTAQEDQIKIFQSYNKESKVMTMSDGSAYIVSSATQISKSGYRFTPDLLSPGERIKLTTLISPAPWRQFLARAEVQADRQVPAPELYVSASQLNGVLVVRGSTTADHIIIIREDGSKEAIPVGVDGSFSRIFTMIAGESNIKAVAYDSKTGGLTGSDISIKFESQGNNARTYLDISDNPDRNSIEDLSSRGIMSGTGNGVFQPEQPVNRADFITMVGRAENWKLDGGSLSYFQDHKNIPEWALGAVYFARQRGIINGYPDGSFGPQEAISRSQMVVILGRILAPDEKVKSNPQMPFSDSSKIPEWALPYYTSFYDRGWLNLFGGSTLDPGRALTRAEAARFIHKILLPATVSS